MLREAGYYSRMAVGIYRLMRAAPPGDSFGLIRRQMENRESTFLETVKRAVFSDPEHPYHRMFRLAGCEYGDLAGTVWRRGLEETLKDLQAQGVYLAHDELKGKIPIVRSGQHIPSGESSFMNPLVAGLIESSSSGSRSRGTRTRQSTEYRVYREAYEIAIRREFALDERVHVALKPILPSAMGLGSCLRASRLGGRVDRWFAVGGTIRESLHYRAVTAFLVALGRAMGARAPFPTYLPPDDFSPVAEWIARRSATGAASVVRGFVSPAVRVAAAAASKGLDIAGTLFLVGGEALTDAKRAVIEAAGAEVSPGYWIHEVGPIGHACRNMRDGNRVHIFRDSVAVISRTRPAPLTDVMVESLLFTTLLPFSPRVLINAEMDDSGTIERAPCDCTFAALGSVEQIRDVASFGKLTGQGVTLVGTDVVRLLEEVLPARLGGRPGDYQLVEAEGGAQTKLTLRVSRRATSSSPEELKECFLREIRRYYGGSLAARLWRHSGALEVVIAEPLATRTGKVLSLHLLGSGKERAHATQRIR